MTNDDIFVLDFQVNGDSISSVISPRTAPPPIPPAGSLVQTTEGTEKHKYLILSTPPRFYFTGSNIVVELDCRLVDTDNTHDLES